MQGRVLGFLAIAMGAALASCGGGGSTGGPIPNPGPSATLTPRTYAASYTWSGAMHGPARTSSARSTMTSSTPEPIQMQQSDGVYGAIGQVNVYASVAPSPSPSVIPTWAPIPASAPVTPGPQGTPGVLTLLPKNQSGAFTLDGTIPIPGAPQTVTPQGYVFPSVPLACTPATDQDPNAVQGVSFQSGVAVAVTSPSQADLYIDGPGCAGAFANSSESDITLHAPGGFARFSLNTQSFMDTTTSQWTNTATSIDWPTLQSTLSDATTAQALWEASTASAHFVRFMLAPVGGDGTATVTYDESGYSVTGSY